jgi:hypothetical protein
VVLLLLCKRRARVYGHAKKNSSKHAGRKRDGSRNKVVGITEVYGSQSDLSFRSTKSFDSSQSVRTELRIIPRTRMTTSSKTSGP